MPPAFDVDWNGAPAEIVAEMAGRGTRLESPCGDGTMVWHRWDGPAGATPAVLFHGGWGSWTHWIKTIPLLAAERTVFAADLPGMGDSADAPEPHSADSISDIGAAGIDAILPNGAPYHMVGFSFGGVIGTWTAAKHGQRCKSLTLVGAAGFGELHFVVMGIRVPDPALPDAETDAIHRDNLSKLMFADPANIDPLALHVHRLNIARGRVRSRRISLSSALTEVLPRVSSPISGIWGLEDSTGGGRGDLEKRRDILRGFQPDCAFDIVDGTGHWIMYETPDLFCQTLSRHLAVNEGAKS